MSGRCVMLTTHSMEECEALCNRLCIMTSGQLKCIGTPQHLKSKFGRGFQLDITLETQPVEGEDHDSVEEKLSRKFKVSLMEKNQNKFVYDIQLHDGHRMKLSEIFRILEGMKEDLNIESYALSGTTLEQVFIKMANQNEAPFVPVENSLHQLQERETRDRERFSDVTSDDKNVLNLLTLQL